MTTSTQNEKGFTLVELAIVLVIVGLLIGGILKGQELIANAQVTATMNQLTGMDAATSTFRDKYNAFPGDMTAGQQRLPNCVAPCNAGNGNGAIDQQAGAAPVVANENVQYFLHLRADGLITGFDGTNNLSFGQALPPSSIGGGFTMGYSAGGANFTAPANGINGQRGHYIATVATAAAVAAGNGALTPGQGGRIDNKVDDGNPTTGTVVGSVNCNANAANNNQYATAQETQQCAVYYRIQG